MTHGIAHAGLRTAALLAAAAAANAADAPITLKAAFEDSFLVGVALNAGQYTEQDANGAALACRQFNSVAPENVMKWDSIHPRPGPDGYNFAGADRYVEFGERNGMFLVGHTLVWHSQTPRWVFQGEDGNPATREVLLERMRDHIHTVVGRYKGRIHAWDVVNEALNDDGSLRQSPWYRIIGEDYIAKAFEYAREADPEAELRYNDYSIENVPKRNGVIALVKKLQAAGAPISGLGSQTHANAVWPGSGLLDSALAEFAELGLPISITELDVDASLRGQRNQSADVSQNAQAAGGGVIDDTDRRLARQYASLFRVFLKHRRNIKLVTFWGVTDRDSWRRAGQPLLFDGEWRPKPAFDAVIAEAVAVTPELRDRFAVPRSPLAAANAPGLPFPIPLRWTSTDILVKPVSDDAHDLVSVKDPTVVRFDGKWHVYATTANTRGQWSMAYLSFTDWAEAADAKPYYIDNNPDLRGYHCAPQVFYFRPHRKWYLIYQSQPPQYSTADDLAKPETWTKPESFFPAKPASAAGLWIDFWVICDDTHAYLFSTGDDGRLYRSRTTIEDFPKGMSDPEIAIEGPRNDVFEGSMTYKLKGTDTYLTLIEAIGPARYYRAWLSDRLDGRWTPVSGADTFANPFAGVGNVSFEEGVSPWTRDISHGELIRDGYDETLTVDPANLQLLYQGRDPAINGRYDQLPYRLGLLRPDISGKPPRAAAPTLRLTGGTARINAGRSTPFTDSAGTVWLPDRGFEGGETLSRDPAMRVEGTPDPGLFLSERYGMDAFACNLPNGKYLVKLYFAETYEGITGPGQRVFSYTVQGHEFNDFDIWVKAGGPRRAHIETVPVDVTDEELRIAFTRRVENPAINAIEIVPQE